jgi:[protein-PII] uridylyltransferase
MDRAGLSAPTHARAIIDRRMLVERLRTTRDESEIIEILAGARRQGAAEVAKRLGSEPSQGRAAAHSTAFLHDQLARIVLDKVAGDSEVTLSLVGLGGTGRGEMAPHSDLDLMLLTPARPTAAEHRIAESFLRLMWDLQLKIGHSLRGIEELLTLSREDLTIRTAFLEGRWMWGSAAPFDEASRRFKSEVVAGTAAEYVAGKLAERDQRHLRMGDSRYVVEPNVKEGKGGLRDLHTLYWIGKYVHGVERPSDLVRTGLLSTAEFRRFDRAERFFWSVRCHLHLLAGRAEERLGFDYQRQIAEVMRYADRPGKSAVERFMQFYFLNAKTVGDLTGVFLAQLDEQLARRGRRFALPTLRRRPRHLKGFTLDRGRLSIPHDQFFREAPVRLIEMFALAANERLEIHPAAVRAAARDSALIDKAVRDDPNANALFLEVLTSPNHPETVLRWMNEAGVFGRFVPDFGRVVAQMQFDMYHHYTVDEHSIRAIGLLAAIERGELKGDHPLATAIIRQIGSRRTLYVAVLLHDIAKGRGGDHSELGAAIATELCPRFGLDSAETETVAWLVRHHLLLSSTAFKRDLSDPQTIETFAGLVQSPERLRLLLVLTVVDIRAVGPGVWTDWKRSLLRSLFEATEERLRLGHKQHGRSELVERRKAALAASLGWPKRAIASYARRLPDSYWLAEPPEWQVANARQIATSAASIGDRRPSIEIADDPATGASRVSIYTEDRDGLFHGICAGLASPGANIVDARIHTTRDGMALDNLVVIDARGRAYSDSRRRNRLVRAIEASLSGQAAAGPRAPGNDARADPTFAVAPSVTIADRASNRTTVVEVNARDRSGLLAALTEAIYGQRLKIHSAHIATYGERAVDVFYLTRADGRKLQESEVAALRPALLEAASA